MRWTRNLVFWREYCEQLYAYQDEVSASSKNMVSGIKVINEDESLIMLDEVKRL